MKKIFVAFVTLIALAACSKKSVEVEPDVDPRTTPNFGQLGPRFPLVIFNLNGHQTEEDLSADNWLGYMGTPSIFLNNVNNSTYSITWNSFWGREYSNVMAPTKQMIQIATANKLPLFASWAKLVRILAMSKLTAVHGPIIYSQYGINASSIPYDKESDLYPLFFKQLDSIQTDFNAKKTYAEFKDYDPSNYAGSIPQWQKVINSLRLRLAMRLSKVDPAQAKIQGEKALKDPAGLINTNADNFTNSLMGQKIPVAQICYEWDDTRMGAAMESFLVGLKDGRISRYFAPVATPALYADHPSVPYKGIRNGGHINAKADHVPFSKVSEDFNTVTSRRNFTAAEVSFLKAEAGLRGWAGAGDPKTNYEDGVKLSFADWGAAGADAYLADKTSKPINYVDPVDARNNFTALSTITVAWDNNDSNELKLEKIITQKYINNFTNTLESWVDFRRTGYPKIPSAAKNASNPTWGVIPAGEFIKRMPFDNAERTGNTAAVADAVTKMGAGAKDDIATRLWFDTGKAANF
ncbi:MAG: SusD/RagB family nutrient-binding outer membrane lipoprotein [Dyadobacter sp.]|uniref:SusD/RagB family nutrient-binding outer membrane lipoprotein n=1 Tax=Dyadobacter sp. TaxID=1914288 RepID=UPI001B0F26B6|nr:SusD/RagB family nutrient-binding outer membrane lipoprotein [Dyadobacter sp.]MBO9616510.1 SusD/RagB family nutrient-binding outer membrane lipoprotein [Dyadobacter sp.]